MRLYLITLGFDEKFATRFLLRHGVRERDVVVLVVAEDYEERKEARAAVEALRGLLEASLEEGGLKIVPVERGDVAGSIRRLLEVLDVWGGVEKVYASLSGGMRFIVIVSLLALAAYTRRRGVPVDVEVDFEDLKGYTALPLDAALREPGMRELRLLRAAAGMDRPTVRSLAEESGLSPSTVHRTLEQLRAMGLIDRSNRSTERGLFALRLWG